MAGGSQPIVLKSGKDHPGTTTAVPEAAVLGELATLIAEERSGVPAE